MIDNIPEWEYMFYQYGKWPHKTVNGNGIVAQLISNNKRKGKAKTKKRK